MKIAHISDLHCDATPRSKNFIHKLLTSIKKVQPDHLVITGDLTHSGHAAEFGTLVDLLEEFGWIDSNYVTIIPGNHDLFPGLFGEQNWEEFIENVDITTCFQRLPSIFKVLKKYKSYSRKDYLYDTNLFIGNFREAHDDTIVLGSNQYPYPFIKLLDPDIALIGFDSNDVYPTLKNSFSTILGKGLRRMISGDKDWIDELYKHSENPICCNGWIDKNRVERALNHPSLKGKKKIVLLHHYLYSLETVLEYQYEPFAYFMRIFEQNLSYLLSQLKKKNVDLVLHGHWHVTEKYNIDNLTVLNSGGSLYRRSWFLITSTPNTIRHRKITF